MVRALNENLVELSFTPSDMVEWFGISPNTARQWLDKWRNDGFILPLNPDAERVWSHILTDPWAKVVQNALTIANSVDYSPN
jgi:hypothetical protein